MTADPTATPRVRRVGFASRLLAYILDSLVVLPLTALVGSALWLTGTATVGAETASAIAALGSLAAALAYYTVLHAHGRQTVGKLAVGAVVTDTSARPIGHGRALGRLGAEVVSTIPLYVGYLWALANRDRQTFHDKLATTLVVRKADLGA